MKPLLPPSNSPAVLRPGEPLYPPDVCRWLGDPFPGNISAIGYLPLLERNKIALFCSVKCRGALILRTYEFAKRIPPEGPVIVSGFHSPLERQVLEVLLRRHVPVIVCPARGLERMRVPPEWRVALAEGRLLILSGFGHGLRRSTREIARRRNLFAAALADRVIIAYASAGGQTERFARDVVRRGKPLLTFSGEGNELLRELGAGCIKDDGTASGPFSLA